MPSDPRERTALVLGKLEHDVAADRACSARRLGTLLRADLQNAVLEAYRLGDEDGYRRGFAAGDAAAHDRPTLEAPAPEGWDDEATPAVYTPIADRRRAKR